MVLTSMVLRCRLQPSLLSEPACTHVKHVTHCVREVWDFRIRLLFVQPSLLKMSEMVVVMRCFKAVRQPSLLNAPACRHIHSTVD